MRKSGLTSLNTMRQKEDFMSRWMSLWPLALTRGIVPVWSSETLQESERTSRNPWLEVKVLEPPVDLVKTTVSSLWGLPVWKSRHGARFVAGHFHVGGQAEHSGEEFTYSPSHSPTDSTCLSYASSGAPSQERSLTSRGQWHWPIWQWQGRRR